MSAASEQSSLSCVAAQLSSNVQTEDSFDTIPQNCFDDGLICMSRFLHAISRALVISNLGILVFDVSIVREIALTAVTLKGLL